MAKIVYARPDDYRAALYVDGELFGYHDIDFELFREFLESEGHEVVDKFIERDEIGLWLPDYRTYEEKLPYEVYEG